MNKPTLRRSQIITTFGPGALVNLLQGSFMAMGIDHWSQNPRPEDRIYDDRFQSQLGVRFFVQPPSEESDKTGLPYRRFPRWMFCPHPACRALRSYEDWEQRRPRTNSNQPLLCSIHNLPLVPMNFLIACNHGHIEDFPWSYWVHRGKQDDCVNPQLKYIKGLSGVGLAGVLIRCETCGKVRDMTGSSSPEAFRVRGCTGSRPWTNQGAERCAAVPRVVQRGGSNVYFPRIRSSIAIPSRFNNLIDEIKRTSGWTVLSNLPNMGVGALKDEYREQLIKEIATQVGCSPTEIQNFIERQTGEHGQADLPHRSEEEYLHDEYMAFHGQFDKNAGHSRDFKVLDATAGADYKKFGINSIMMVQSLREVRALVGFTRVQPLDGEDVQVVDQANEGPVQVNIGSPESDWFPAMEVRGEGIFVTLDKERIDKWAKNADVRRRIDIMNTHARVAHERRHGQGSPFRPVSSKRVLLHTFAHLLIRQLSFECGYASASLRERVYCDEGGENEMQGVLIYTAAGDADGTLGGLVRQARNDRFPGTLVSMLENSIWCSNDPLCLESHGQGFESLNLAACYACTLLAETSCENFNKFLDRALVVGLPDNPDVGFFKDALNNQKT